MIHSRGEWTDRQVPNPAPQFNVETGFFHHEGGPVRGVAKTLAEEAKILAGIEENEIADGLTSIDYNLMVFQSGNIWEGRGLYHEDAATLGWNARSVSVCAVGNFEKEDPTDALIMGIGWSFRAASESNWLVDVPALMGHRESGFATACPGSKLFARKTDIIAAFNGKFGTAVPQPKQETEMLVLAKENDKKDARIWTFNGQTVHLMKSDEEFSAMKFAMGKAGLSIEVLGMPIGWHTLYQNV